MLNKCKNANCDPVVQVRGRMGPGDYPGQDENYHLRAEMEDSIRDDVRICCKVCGAVSGWCKADAPGMPGAGLDYMQKLWNEKYPG